MCHCGGHCGRSATADDIADFASNDSAPGARRELQRLTAAQKAENLRSPQLAGVERLERAFDNSPAMHIGEHGDGVRRVQEALVDDGFELPGSTRPTGELDGQFGPETFAVLKAFQAKHGLDADGIVGRETLRALDDVEAAQRLLKPRPGSPAIRVLSGGVEVLDRPGPVPIPGIGPPSILFGQVLGGKDAADLARIPPRGVNLTITTKNRPKRNRSGPSSIRVFADLEATASVQVLPGPPGDTFTFAFIQVCRPFEVLRAVYHEIGTPPGNEIDWNPGEAARPQQNATGAVIRSSLRLPAFDVLPGGTFTPMVSQKAPTKGGQQKSRSRVESRPITHGALGDLFFEDIPTAIFDVVKEHKGTFYDLAGFAASSFFYTALVVRLPSGKIEPLKAFFWDVKACERLKPAPGEQGYVNNLFKQTATGDIHVSPVHDCRSRGCFASELNLSGFGHGQLGNPVPPGETCNEIIDAAVSSTNPIGPAAFDIGCG